MGGGMNRYKHMIEKTYYIYQRYGIVSTFALLHHELPLALSDLGEFIRLSDHVIPIDDQHDFIIYAFTPESGAHKASQNLLRKLDDHFGEQCCRIAIDSFDPDKTPHHVLSRLKQIIDEIRKNSFSRIENELILDARY